MKSPKDQAIAEAVAIRKRREELGQGDAEYNKPEAMREWLKLRIAGIREERAR